MALLVPGPTIPTPGDFWAFGKSTVSTMGHLLAKIDLEVGLLSIYSTTDHFDPCIKDTSLTSSPCVNV